jgi:hypothetical protein
MTKSGKDFLTAAGAHELATTVRAYWAEKGHVVRVSVVTEERKEREKVLSVVRSNLFNGLPHLVINEKPGRRVTAEPGHQQKEHRNANQHIDE